MRALSVGANLTAATNTTLYTVPTGYYAKVVLLRAANATSSNKHITFDWVDASASATYSVVYQQAITAKTTFDWDGAAYFVMEEGDQLKATSESASTFAVVVTIEEEGLTRT
jgi:hypothetical protein